MTRVDTIDPLWVPLLSHYRDDGSLDVARVRAQIASIRPHVRQYLVAGTTGDGWSMPDAVLDQWLDVCSDDLGTDQTVLVGTFGPDAAAVIARARRVEAHFSRRPSQATFAGITVCGPVDPAASQEAIYGHLRQIHANTTARIALYQLPQITGTEIAPALLERFAGDDRIAYFKDSSGGDTIARHLSGSRGYIVFLRGAEGHYLRHLRDGQYDGWLLSTANGFGADLRHVADLFAAGRIADAEALSARIDTVVDAVFAQAAALGGNAFADANRGVDHVLAFGDRWRAAPPPRRFDGSVLPVDFLDAIATLLSRSGLTIAAPYVAAALPA